MGPSDTSTATARPATAAVIYVVDDSPELAEMLEVFLQGAGFPTRIFCEPLQAVEALAAATPKPRLLVTDFQMPGMNGMELIQRCRALHPALKVISASGHLPEAENADYPSRPDRVLSKPYTTRQLVEVVNELLSP